VHNYPKQEQHWHRILDDLNSDSMSGVWFWHSALWATHKAIARTRLLALLAAEN
jgi:hypothetical protein